MNITHEKTMKQTAVEWFFMTMNIRGLLPNDEIVECYNQAKAMEKEQIIEAYRKGTVDGWKDEAYEYPYEYYNETFKSE